MKELADHLTSRRFLIILVLIYGTCLASLYGALSGLSDAAEAGTEYLFLELYTTSGNSIPSFLTFIGLLGPFLGLTLGFDAIKQRTYGWNSEPSGCPANLPGFHHHRKNFWQAPR